VRSNLNQDYLVGYRDKPVGIIREVRRKLNIDVKKGILGNENGIVRDASTGNYYVRIERGPGIYYPAVPFPLLAGAVIDPAAGIPVHVGYDTKTRRDVIVSMNTIALSTLGISPLRANPNDPASSDLVPQERIAFLYSRPHPNTNNYPFYAQVYPARLADGDSITTFAGAKIDLSSLLPDPLYHRYVIVFLKSDFATLEAFGSTVQLTTVALDDTDLTDAFTQRTANSIPIRAYKMTGSDATLNGSLTDSPFLRQFVTETATKTPVAGFIRATTAIYRRYYHVVLGSANPGGSGPTWVEASANTTGGWRLTNAAWYLRGQADVHADWDGASDLSFDVNFMVNVNNTGGGAGDTVDIKATVYYKGVGDTATKSQVVEVPTTVGASAQYKQFRAEFTIDWDYASNVVEVGDVIAIVINLETDTSEVDDIVVTSMEFYYNTTHLGIESGDV